MRRTTPTTRLGAVVAATLITGGAWMVAPAAEAVPVITFVEECPTGGSPPPTPGPNCTPQPGTIVQGKRAIVFSADAGSFNRIRRVDLFVLSMEEGIPSPGNPPGSSVRTWEWPDVADAPRNTGTLRFTWDSEQLTRYNGVYKIRVNASTHAPDSSNASSERTDLSVDNAPATPSAPTVLAATTDGVSLEWSDPPEPDFLSFTLYRARTDSSRQAPGAEAFAPVALTQKTKIFDEVDGPGAYWYRLTSTRRSVVTPDDGISSDRSATSEDAGVVTTPTPAPKPGGSTGSGGSGGGSGSGTGSRSVTTPQLTPRPLLRTSFRAPPLRDAPFSQILPYDLPDDGEDGLPLAQDDFGDDGGEDTAPGALSAVAIGVFLVSAALVVGRVPA